MEQNNFIRIGNASENNLKSVSIDIPKNKLILVTGVSGSGKSSLVYDVIYREAENRYLGSFSSYALQWMGKMRRPAVESIRGLQPAIAIDQKSLVRNPRSTAGTITGLYDMLRLLFARLGKTENAHVDFKIERSLFSFNSPAGACPVCNGLGVEDRLDPELIVADKNKSLRQGCMVITAPNGYIIYSQVTMDILDQVCHAEGFSVDIPWKDLTPEQKDIIWYGSDKIEIPYGKHTLESRMRWTGITAKPRETGYYKGILPVMETILKRDRNKNILRFVRSVKCNACHGTRLNDNALSVKIYGHSIADLAALQLNELQDILNGLHFNEQEKEVAWPVIYQMNKLIDLLKRLGLEYLSLDRESTTLSGGEAQRLRLATQAGTGLSGLLYIFDEPSVGLHPHDTNRLIEVLEGLRDKGNTVMVVEHEEAFIQHADWLIDIGPAAGDAGGRVLLNLPATEINNLPESEIYKSRTLSFYKGLEKIEMSAKRRQGNGWLEIKGAEENNLKNIDVRFLLEALNVVSGVSGAGKSTLTVKILGNFLHNKLHGARELPGKFHSITGWENISKVITIDQSPIGRTPRSNPATYTGMFDYIRDLFASLPEAKAKNLGKGMFSFNTPGGRCESCQGAGYQEVGMHFMDNVEMLCEECNGRRFGNGTLAVGYKGKNISEILDMSVSEACNFFADQPKIFRYVETMEALGLGYLRLGQRSSTLSGGEAQRIKLASELARPQSAHTLYILDEPTTGLHQADVNRLLQALHALADQQNTVILIEHHLGMIAAADHVIDLGPGSGRKGGTVVVSGTPDEVAACDKSLTGQALKRYFSPPLPSVFSDKKRKEPDLEQLKFTSITTHNLQHIDITIPHNKVTVLTGVSGSGKSSFAFDTLFAEGQNRFMESFSPYLRSQMGMQNKADFEEVSGLTPVIAIGQRELHVNPRSTVGTLTGIYDLYRLLYSRVAQTVEGESAGLSSMFSFNHQSGACKHCGGLGVKIVCDPTSLITHPEKSIVDGAMDGTKTGKFYGDPYGQYIATLQTVGRKFGYDFSKAWNALSEKEKQVALYGTGEEEYEITWNFKRNNTTGKHHFNGKWPGFTTLVEEEYDRKHADHRGQSMLTLMNEINCPECNGARLQKEVLRFILDGINIAELASYPVEEALVFFHHLPSRLQGSQKQLSQSLCCEIIRRLENLQSLGLSYISMRRSAHSLSGGEAQRVRLAAQLGNGLTGITYVLDEPTVGLHPSDVSQLMKIIRQLQQLGNTIVIVEHNKEVILAADHVIELGPGAGRNGGKIVAEGSPETIKFHPDSVSAKYLNEKISLKADTSASLQPGIVIRKANANNLKNTDVEIPSGGMIVITGVSGSGKSTLVYDVLYASKEKNRACGCASVEGLERFQRVVAVRQKSQISSSTGTPATYAGIFDHIRDIFAATDDARRLSLRKNHFSFTEKTGWCETCQGRGKVKISMDFLSDVWRVCDDCQGNRYRAEVLSCFYHDKNIAQVLEMTMQEATDFFAGHKTLTAQFAMLQKVGLGYLQLGQALDTLSGGETQRLTLATELMRPAKGTSLYLLDEPSTGLHFRDVEYLLALFRALVAKGHTLIVIEHDSQIILQADYVIDLGPGGGNKGGYLVAQGRVEDIVACEQSITGRFLKNL